MANKRHVTILTDGTSAIDKWRRLHPGMTLDLSDLDVLGEHSHVRRNAAALDGANLEGANLDRADLSGVHLRHVNLKNAQLTRSVMGAVNLESGEIVSLESTDLSGADLRGARIEGWPGLYPGRQVIMAKTKLTETLFIDCDFASIDLSEAVFDRTVLARCDLNGAIGLERVEHRKRNYRGGSNVDIETLVNTLRGATGGTFNDDQFECFAEAGVPPTLLRYLPSDPSECRRSAIMGHHEWFHMLQALV